jgi:hypothetical protein
MDFFDPDCPGKRASKMDPESRDDICATEFLAKGEWAEAVGQVSDSKPREYGEYRKVVNKLAAHLTYKRIEHAERAQRGEQDFTPSKEVTEYLLCLANLFWQKLPDHRAAWFGEMMIRWDP